MNRSEMNHDLRTDINPAILTSLSFLLLLVVLAFPQSALSLPDLVISSASLSDSTVEQGERVRIDVTVKNQGDETASSSRVGYYLSSGGSISLLDDDAVSSLRAGRSDDEYERIDTDDLTPGNYCIGVVADYTGKVDESDEDNNNYASLDLCFTVTAPASKPDVSSVGSASATEGGSLNFTVSLSGSTSRTATYYYSTYYGGSATAEQGDYAGVAEQSVQVGSGSSSFTVTIRSNQDADFDDETFYLYVTDSDDHPNATPGSSQNRGTGTIYDDDTSDDHSNTLVGATSLTLGGSLSGQIETGSDVDYFRVQVDGSGVLTVYTAGSLNTMGTLQDGSGSPLGNQDDDGGDGSNFRIERTVNAGAYYVKVESYGSGTGSYTLHASFSAASTRQQVSIADAEATEGNPVRFTVTLNPAPIRSVTFYYATYRIGNTVSGRPGSGQDYEGKFATPLTFSSGQTNQTISISTLDDTEDESDEQFYVYITDTAGKLPQTGTPSDYLARATGTIREGGGSTGLTRLYWEIAGGITGGAALTINAGQQARMVAVFGTRPSGAFTFKIYEADVSGGQLVRDATVPPVSISAVNVLQDGSRYKLSVPWTSIFRAGTESVSPDQAEYYFTVEQGGTVLGSMLDDANARTGILNKVGPLLSVESSVAKRPTPTPPTPTLPSGEHTYTFRSDNKTYKVTSDACYSLDTTPKSQDAMKAYIAGLRIYNSRNELVRPPDDILSELIAAHASACVLSNDKFRRDIREEIQSIEEQMSIIEGYIEGFEQEAYGSRILDTAGNIIGAVLDIDTIDAINTAIEIGKKVGKEVGKKYGIKAGVKLRVKSFGILGGLDLIINYFASKKEESQKQAANNLIITLFYVSIGSLENSKQIFEEIKMLDLSKTINIDDLNYHMYFIDRAYSDLTYVDHVAPTGWRFAKILYPALEGSTYDKVSHDFLSISSSIFSPIQILLDYLLVGEIIRKMTYILDNHEMVYVDISPFVVLKIHGYALGGTHNADIMRNTAPGAGLYGGNGNDWMYSEAVTTTLYGEGGDDHLFGGSQDDELMGGPGDDVLKGGGGQDVAGFGRSRENYDIRWDSAREWLTVSSAADGSDSVYKDIEFLRFADGTVETRNIEGPLRNLPPFLAGNIEDQTALVGKAFRYSIPSSIFIDPDGDRLTWDVSGLPGWLDFNPTTRLLSGTPTTRDVGRTTITVRVAGSSDTERFTLSVVKPNTAPVLTVPDVPYVVDEDGGWTRLPGLSVFDEDNDNLSLVVAAVHGQLRATGTMVVDLDVSNVDVGAAIGFRNSSPSAINRALATLEYKPPRNWQEDGDLILLSVTDDSTQTFGGMSVHSDTLKEQIVAPSPARQTALPNTSVGLDVNYSTNPANQQTRGLGLRLHFDSSQIRFDGLANVFSAALLQQGTAEVETADMDDGDPDTDRVVSVVWADPTGANWPAAFPVRLYTATFTTAADFNASTRVNFTASETAADFTVDMQSATLEAGSGGYLDVDGNGESDGLTDGIWILQYLFGFRGADLIDEAVASDATRSTAEAIEGYLASVIEQDVLDVDGDGNTDALTDGVLILQYLFGSRGADLIDGAVAPGATRRTAEAIEDYLASIE